MTTNTRSPGMPWGESLRLALETLRAHKLRSYLTLLGIILAVTTLVAVMSVVHGLNVYVADRVATLGASTFVVDRFGIITNRRQLSLAQRRPVLTPEDYRALSERLQLARRVAAIESDTADVRAGKELYEDARVVGATPSYGEVRNLEVAAGRFLVESDELYRRPVCFLASDLAARFFPNVDPIGRTVRAGNHTYRVIGVAEAIGSVFGMPQDNFIIIPLSVYRKEWHTPNGSLSIFVEAAAVDGLDQAQDEARALLRARHHLPYDAPDDFGMIVSASVLSLWERITGDVFAMAIWLTGVFFVVGGIVIMNIMLASVTERTHEIGIRKAVGARRRDIVAQLLAESAALSAAGGVAGVILAVAIATVVRRTTLMPVSTPASAVVTALAVSTAVGLFFGIYPALRAARLDPVEALRAEG